ncbi:MAG: hypothetical protein ABIT05_01795 [Chitinophagaceae bacterium]
MKLLSLLTLCVLFTASQSAAQPGKDSTSSPGGHFSTSGGRYFWMGRNYRQEWNTPVNAPIINLATEHGGLTPVKRGGGKQTKSLRLEDPQGKQYTLRSIAKFITSKTLPGDLQSDAAADLVSDGVSASYPYAALSIPVLNKAAGIPHGPVKLVYIGDDPKLGEYRKDFGNMLALYEQRLPDSVSKGYDTDEVADKLEKDNDNDVDQAALLRIRILDMFVMDLDRHEDQWIWGAYDYGKGKMFYPIAKDRDQAFYINQGLLPGLIKGRSLVPQLEGFKPKAKSIERFNFAARNLDRFFLNELTEEDWRREVESFVSKMTDAVIESSLSQQPNEIENISAAKIIQTLKDRRNYLVAEVMEYYAFLSEIVSVTSSDKKELFNITRNDDGSLLVQVYKTDKDGSQSVKMYERKFFPLVTKEVRLYGFDGDDRFLINGTNDKIKLRMIGGGGQDVYENTTKSPGGLVYDKKDGNNTLTGPFRNKMSHDTAINSFQRIYYKYPFQSIFITGGYNPDDGISLGPTFKFIRHGFRKTPYKSLHQFRIAYAFSTKAVNMRYNNEFIGVFGGKTDILTDISYKGPNNTSNFFGYGMNSIYDKTKPKKFKYYRIRYDLGDISLLLRRRLSEKIMISLGPTFQFYSLDSTDDLNKKRNVVLNTLSGLNYPNVFKKQSYFGVLFNFIVDTRNHRAMPDKGVNWVTTIRSMTGITKYSYEGVTQLNTDLSFYVNLIHDRLVFADRIGAGTTTSKKFEFYQAQYLGSDENLRGYRKERFAGKSKFYNQAELRLRLANFHTYLFPASFGIFGFVDFGRVWVENDTDKKMATGYGGGLWFSPLRRFVISVSYAVSKEDNIPLVGLSFKF